MARQNTQIFDQIAAAPKGVSLVQGRELLGAPPPVVEHEEEKPAPPTNRACSLAPAPRPEQLQ